MSIIYSCQKDEFISSAGKHPKTGEKLYWYYTDPIKSKIAKLRFELKALISEGKDFYRQGIIEQELFKILEHKFLGKRKLSFRK